MTFSMRSYIAVIIALVLVLCLSSSVVVAQDWRRIPSTGTPSFNRMMYCLDFYAPNNEIMVFGGGFPRTNEMWAFNVITEMWRPIFSQGTEIPDPRTEHECAIIGAYWFVFGGRTNTGTASSDLWRLSIDDMTWSIVSVTTTPEPRNRHSMVAAQGNLYLWGGRTGSSKDVPSEVWEFTPNAQDLQSGAWSKIPEAPGAPKWFGAPLDLLPNGDLVTYGGRFDTGYNSDVHTFNIATKQWTKVSAQGTGPGARALHGTFLDGMRLYIMFGYDDNEKNDFFSIDLSSSQPMWESHGSPLIDPTKADDFARSAIFGVTIPGRGYGLLFGGSAAGNTKNDVVKLEFATKQVSQIHPVFLAPATRAYHAGGVINGNLLIFGGQTTGSEVLNDLWRFDLEKERWDALPAVAVSPFARYGHSGITWAGMLVIFGGVDSAGVFAQDLWLLDPTKFTLGPNPRIDPDIAEPWTQILSSTSAVSPPARAHHGAELVPGYKGSDTMFIFGGTVGTSVLDDLWMMRLHQQRWEQIPKSTKWPPPVAYCSLEYNALSGTLWLIGGADSSIETDMFWVFHLSNSSWTSFQMPGAFAQAARRLSTATASGEKGIVILGGYSLSTMLSVTGERLNAWMVADAGSLVVTADNTPATSNTPSGLAGHLAVLYRSEVITFGGFGATKTLDIMKDQKHNQMYAYSPVRPWCVAGATLCEWGCAPGHEPQASATGDPCPLCQPGKYSTNGGPCQSCPQGFANTLPGASSELQCRPCSEGSFAPSQGISSCVPCPEGKHCPVGAQTPIDAEVATGTGSSLEVPPALKSNAKLAQDVAVNSSLAAAITALCASLVAYVVWAIKDHDKDVLRKFNLWANPDSDTKDLMVTHVVTMGAAFFILASAISLLVSYFADNERESRSLLPFLFANDPATTDVSISLLFHHFGGECVCGEGASSPTFTIDTEGIESVNNLNWTTCELQKATTGDRQCQVSWHCNGCLLGLDEAKAPPPTDCSGCTAEIAFRGIHSAAGASHVDMHINASSSVPNINSTLTHTLSPDKKRLFRGSQASIFRVQAIPSFYKHESKGQNDTGYSFGLLNAAQGAQVKPDTYQLNTGIGVQIALHRTETALHTTRRFAFAPLTFFAGSAASLRGMVVVSGVVLLFLRLLRKGGSAAISRVRSDHKTDDAKAHLRKVMQGEGENAQRLSGSRGSSRPSSPPAVSLDVGGIFTAENAGTPGTASGAAAASVAAAAATAEMTKVRRSGRRGTTLPEPVGGSSMKGSSPQNDGTWGASRAQRPEGLDLVDGSVDQDGTSADSGSNSSRATPSNKVMSPSDIGSSAAAKFGNGLGDDRSRRYGAAAASALVDADNSSIISRSDRSGRDEKGNDAVSSSGPTPSYYTTNGYRPKTPPGRNRNRSSPQLVEGSGVSSGDGGRPAGRGGSYVSVGSEQNNQRQGMSHNRYLDDTNDGGVHDDFDSGGGGGHGGFGGTSGRMDRGIVSPPGPVQYQYLTQYPLDRELEPDEAVC